MKASIHISIRSYSIYMLRRLNLLAYSACVLVFFIWSSRHHSLQLFQQSYNVSMYHTQYKPNPTLYSLNIPIHSSNIIIFPTLYSTSLNVYILVCSLVLRPPEKAKSAKGILHIHTTLCISTCYAIFHKRIVVYNIKVHYTLS